MRSITISFLTFFALAAGAASAQSHSVSVLLQARSEEQVAEQTRKEAGLYQKSLQSSDPIPVLLSLRSMADQAVAIDEGRKRTQAAWMAAIQKGDNDEAMHHSKAIGEQEKAAAELARKTRDQLAQLLRVTIQPPEQREEYAQHAAELIRQAAYHDAMALKKRRTAETLEIVERTDDVEAPFESDAAKPAKAAVPPATPRKAPKGGK